ncbi:MAG: hypothetical protein QM704_22375 [Anaeromyxobacteraceae bacterium]
MPIELAIPAALAATVALGVATWNVLERRRYERMKLTGGRKALVRNLFGG